MNIPQTTPIKIFRRNILLGLLLFFCAHLFIAQNKLLKLDKEFSFSQIPLFKLNSSHTKIIFTSWDKESIGITAYAIGKVDNEYLKNVNDLWEIQIQSSDSILILDTNASRQLPAKVISSYSSSSSAPNLNPSNILLNSVLNAESNYSANNKIPTVLLQKLKEYKFDFEAYKRLGETYFKIWEYNLVKDLDQKSTKEVQDWYNQMSTKLISISKNNNLINVANTEEKNMSYSFYESHTIVPNVSVDKVIELKIPRRTQSFLDARFGSVQFNNDIKNIQAKLKYTSFEASIVKGVKTSISASSAPVQIQQWDNGKLNLAYVKSCEIGAVNNIQLVANSSKMLIHLLNGKGDFKSTFSQLGIDKTSTAFSSLSFLSTNSDLVLNLPQQAYNFVYSGEMSGITIPKNKLELKSLGDYKNLMLHGYSLSRNTDKEIQMNMVNSQIILK